MNAEKEKIKEISVVTLPLELAERCEHYSPIRWPDIAYQCECGLDLIEEEQDFYSARERSSMRRMFTRWLARAKREIEKQEKQNDR